MRHSVHSVAVIGLALCAASMGCGSKSDNSAVSSSTGGGDCGAAVDKGTSAIVEQLKQKTAAQANAGSGANPEFMAKRLERAQKIMDELKPILTAHCSQDSWPAEVVTCIGNVTSRPDLQGCITKLPKELADKVSGDMMKVMQAGMGMHMRPGGGGHEMPPLGSVPPGSPPANGSGGSAAPAPAGSAAPAPAAPAAPAAVSPGAGSAK